LSELRVRECRSPAEVGPPRAWDALRARPPASLTGSRPWVIAAFATAHPEATPWLIAVEARGRLVALLSLALHDCEGDPVLRFAGAPHNDLTDLMARPGYEDAAADAAVEALRSAAARGWSVRLDDVDPRGALAAADRRARLLTWSPDDPAPTIDLRGPWRSAASSHRRQQWSRALRRLRDRHRVCFRHVDGEDVLGRLPQFIELRAVRLHATGRPELPPHDFLECAVHGLAPRGQCAVMELLVDGHLAASDLYLLDQTVAMSWARALNPRWRRFPCGHLLLLAAADRFASAGFEVLDFGRGDEPYKFLFGADRRVLLSGRLLSPQWGERELSSRGVAG
jgi:CelD/BcsL family acetyltransferase involved in cellulose biosynthesis